MSRGEFYRWRQEDKYNNPGSRCPWWRPAGRSAGKAIE